MPALFSSECSRVSAIRFFRERQCTAGKGAILA
jgi:hypothetical protein